MKSYQGKDIEVTYDTARCLHAAECVCRCGQSKNQPFCDRSGPCRDWQYLPAGLAPSLR